MPARAPKVRCCASGSRLVASTPVMTFEPGDTPVGKQLREILLDHETGELSPRTEALLYAADRAEHVASVIRPALKPRTGSDH